MELDYHFDIRIWLSLEDYHNNGLSSQETKDIIESIYSDPRFNTKLRCSTMGINGNWIVSGMIENFYHAENLVREIEMRLDSALRKKQKQG